jgi:hypothetical protein
MTIASVRGLLVNRSVNQGTTDRQDSPKDSEQCLLFCPDLAMILTRSFLRRRAVTMRQMRTVRTDRKRGIAATAAFAAVIAWSIPAWSAEAAGHHSSTDAAKTSQTLPGPSGSQDVSPVRNTRNCEPIDFSTAGLEHQGTDFVLTVTGQSRYANAEITFIPVMYVMMPDYWQISLVGCRSPQPKELPLKPYSVKLIVNGTLGHKGIRLLGASPGAQQRIDLP